MENKTEELLKKINLLCIEFYFIKQDTVIKSAKEMAGDIKEFCDMLLQGNIFEMDDDEYNILCKYTVGVLQDYMGALEYEDSLWMIDTLDHGLRELLNMFVDDEATEENGNE